LEYVANRNVIFADLPDEHPAAKFFNFLKNLRLIDSNPEQYLLSGYGSFEGGEGVYNVGPDDIVTRLQVVKMGLTTNCIPIYQEIPPGSEFIDFPRKKYADPGIDFMARVIYTASDNGFIDGYEDGTIRPWAPASKNHIWKIILESSGAMPNDYTPPAESRWLDIYPADWIFPYLTYADELGLVTEEELFQPNQSMPRSKLAEILTRVLSITPEIRPDLLNQIDAPSVL
jgi:hypothetical protein